MNAVNAVASALNRLSDAVTLYFKDNAVVVGILLAAVCYFRSRNPDHWSSQGYVLSSSGQRQQGENDRSSTTRTTADDSDSRREEMRRVRERQQDIANERAKEALRKRKEKEAEEKERKNNVAKDSKPETGSRLGDGSSTTNTSSSTGLSGTSGRNPLQPGTSNSSSYRPARRNPNA
mmetsp:Transcript_25973/g.61102  ORF Transcript_25973/g.61102 Transcript_25973/m.61102 type:complete len:177 (-) Transcript_25973:365-895(-)|eukprot:CAMPEP_0172403376 /NCGR_PEP_ID=MMETSP1061-20121228/58972_1 /TAXON_ID=37318 /ORGANISM="Pseudo-nitzschia pungens, Strain cf. pungens" /LENGTH=176 /DNA_ID=CAMNT_0013137757 /DNA_START=76 /DNA_END=606 /DNA_ORIENTATION=+